MVLVRASAGISKLLWWCSVVKRAVTEEEKSRQTFVNLELILIAHFLSSTVVCTRAEQSINDITNAKRQNTRLYNIFE